MPDPTNATAADGPPDDRPVPVGYRDGIPVPVPGTPDGLVAYVPLRADGTAPRDRRGRLKVTRVLLGLPHPTVPPVAPGGRVEGLTAPEQRWATGTRSRRWPGIRAQFAHRATEVAHRLARAGVVTLDCDVDHHAHLNQIRGWMLTPAWEQHRTHHQTQAGQEATRWQARAEQAAAVCPDPALATAITTLPVRSPHLPVLVHAAEDLAAGIRHDGPRAFSQSHFGDSKERDDVADVLEAAGVAPETLTALGLTRSPYLGLAGPLLVTSRAGSLALAGLPGPTLFRLGRNQPLHVAPTGHGHTLAVVENLQAAEAACDRHPDLMVLYSGGQPSAATVAVFQVVAQAATRVLVVPDADLGGVRIARRFHDATPDHPHLRIVDVGTVAHTPGQPFGEVSRAGLRALSQGAGAVAAFAAACLSRGHRVEQEAVIRASLDAALRTAEP